jgi:cell volume regulation protein A
VALVVRGNHSFVPDDRTKLRHGDEVLIVAPRRLREATEQRIRAVSRSGRLAGWFGERGKPDRDGTPFRRRARESGD